MNKILDLSSVETVSMADEWFEIATEEHFWMKWRFSVLKKFKKYLPPKGSKLFEIGCGNAIVINQIEKEFEYTIDGCDLNKYALELSNPVNGNLMVYNIYDENPDLLKKYDMAILLDVIEHIDDDVDFLIKSSAHIKKGGKVLVNVPALMHLFSKYDTIAGHKRRYTKKSLRQSFEKAGLKVESIRYWGALLYPIAVIRKIVLGMKTENIIETGFKPPSKIFNTMFSFMNSIENIIPFKIPFGTSLMIIATKTNE